MKAAKKALKKCDIAKEHVAFGFDVPVISSMAECSGCRNPDDNELEQQCRACRFNEYFV